MGGVTAPATDLADRWPLSGHARLRAELESAWRSAGRGYHDARHLVDVLDRLDELEDAGTPFARTEVVLAAWFHDGVYDDRPRPEDRSARWAESALATAACDAREVARLVRLTEHHRVPPGDRNGAALCDADLAVLAAPARRYADYVSGVRREWRHLPEPDFAAGRLAVLEALAAQEHLFATEHGRRRWEQAARANLAAEVVSLRAAARRPSDDAAPPRAGEPPAPAS
jgi:predicted metal-dependent HD superfamily phosphohydrolase